MLEIYKKSKEIEKLEKEYNKRRDLLFKYAEEDFIDWKKLDLYFILGVDSFRNMELPTNVLLHMYKKRIKGYHPDKRKVSMNVFFSIQNAYKVLSDKYWKLKYDQYFLEDLEIKDKEYSEEEFYELFGKYFTDLSKFSVKEAPKFVIESTIEEINHFYSFYKNFQSTRSFEFLTYEETENKENKQKNIKYDELVEIKKIVEIAKRRDPRIIKYNKENGIVNKLQELTVDGWTETDIKTFKKIVQNSSIKNRVNWPVVLKKFKTEDNRKLTIKELMDKYNQILKNK
ncbi:Zuotin [Spraguea lophii 42_110]|uniref:Zuotin n=1 Tax=Spraguea lophii (strain 42_110) TaxID=1358809 RepID=S7WAN7_SPRLO|nr:Zuotin [Spraguea lophii 42_110]